jgi:hypothetical protein
MTESSQLWSTSTSGDGTSTYTQADTSLFMKVAAACSGFEGVAPGLLNSLAVTGTSSPVAVNTGGGIVDGKPYYNSASVNVNIATPASLTRIDRIVLRADWAAHTVRITRIAGTEGGAAPAITQTSGTTYDIMLAQASITTGGVITVTDERVWARNTTQTGDVTITNAGVTAIGANKVLVSMLNGIALNRQGGSATEWDTAGTSNYTPTTNKIQVGTITATWGSNTPMVAVSVTFPVAFTYKPIILLSIDTNSGTETFSYWLYSTSASAFTVRCYHAGVDPTSTIIRWLAIGPA